MSRVSFVTKLSDINIKNWSSWVYGLIEKYQRPLKSDDLVKGNILDKLNIPNGHTNHYFKRILEICFELQQSKNSLVKTILLPEISLGTPRVFSTIISSNSTDPEIPYVADESSEDSKFMKLFYELIYVGGIVYFTKGDSDIKNANEKLSDFFSVVKNFESSGLEKSIVDQMARVYILNFHAVIINSIFKQIPYLRYIMRMMMPEMYDWIKQKMSLNSLDTVRFYFISKVFINKRCFEWEATTEWNNRDFIRFQEDEIRLGPYDPEKAEIIELPKDFEDFSSNDHAFIVDDTFGKISQDIDPIVGRFIPESNDLIQSEVPLLYVISIKK